MGDRYWWYVLFVRAGREKRVVCDFTRRIGTSCAPFDVRPFVPETERYYRAGKKTGEPYRKAPLFPGYVIVETDMPADRFIVEYSSYFYGSDDIIKLLRYGNTDIIAVPDDERERFEYLFKGKRCLDRSIGYIEGDRVNIVGGPLIGHEGSIKHINRHNRDALIEFEMFGTVVSAKVALEIVSKT